MVVAEGESAPQIYCLVALVQSVTDAITSPNRCHNEIGFIILMLKEKSIFHAFLVNKVTWTVCASNVSLLCVGDWYPTAKSYPLYCLVL